MRVHRHTLSIRTQQPIEFIDISEELRRWTESQGLRNGLLTVSSPHTTARVVINEPDAALQRDMKAQLERFAPADIPYEHNRHTVDGRDNAHAHLAALFMPATESVMLAEGQLQLGAWQAVFFVELDGPRDRREVQLQLMGE